MNAVRRTPARDRGAATAEIAVALPVLLAIVWLLLGVLRIGHAQVDNQDAARAAARAASRGETSEVVQRTAQLAAGGADVFIERVDGLLVVEVSSAVPWLGPWHLAPVTVRGRAVAYPQTSIGAS